VITAADADVDEEDDQGKPVTAPTTQFTLAEGAISASAGCPRRRRN
jgi:hypothetical protein